MAKTEKCKDGEKKKSGCGCGCVGTTVSGSKKVKATAEKTKK